MSRSVSLMSHNVIMIVTDAHYISSFSVVYCSLLANVPIDSVSCSTAQSRLPSYVGLTGARQQLWSDVLASASSDSYRYLWSLNPGSLGVLASASSDSYRYLWSLNPGSLDVLASASSDSYRYLWSLNPGSLGANPSP